MPLPELDQFTIAYIEAALLAETDDDGEPLDKNYGFRDIAPQTLTKMIEDCRKFQEENINDIRFRLPRAGHDFFLTRQHAGCGYWDGEWPIEASDRLTPNAQAYGEFNLYVGDDGMIHH